MPEPTVPNRTDTPAVALGPTALVLGSLSAMCALTPALAFGMLPWAIIAGGLAVTLGPAGIHHARLGTGRLWTAIAGTTLGAAGLAGTIALLWGLSG
ncbi:hypothetical protein [Streptomyces sp. H27-C3]|uniref:hypothetical protein n=1 Tax=Streptomyces sp. H27-C3 TaxID=3046305 RepID=UPI0024B88008|nr:hypothetical protein [Streptomyces sp. H27-C3]MDJ0466439.1 hypothetical protein [Streptomyces sp. H27-C3]